MGLAATVKIPDLSHFQHSVNKLNQLQKANEVVSVYYYSLRLFIAQYSIKKSARSMMNFCSTACPTVECVTSISTNVRRLSRAMAVLLEGLKRRNVYSPLIPPFERMLSEWDEFAEDCDIATDPEIRDLFTKVADAL